MFKPKQSMMFVCRLCGKYNLLSGSYIQEKDAWFLGHDGAGITATSARCKDTYSCYGRNWTAEAYRKGYASASLNEEICSKKN